MGLSYQESFLSCEECLWISMGNSRVNLEEFLGYWGDHDTRRLTIVLFILPSVQFECTQACRDTPSSIASRTSRYRKIESRLFRTNLDFLRNLGVPTSIPAWADSRVSVSCSNRAENFIWAFSSDRLNLIRLLSIAPSA